MVFVKAILENLDKYIRVTPYIPPPRKEKVLELEVLMKRPQTRTAVSDEKDQEMRQREKLDV